MGLMIKIFLIISIVSFLFLSNETLSNFLMPQNKGKSNQLIEENGQTKW